MESFENIKRAKFEKITKLSKIMFFSNREEIPEIENNIVKAV